MNLASTGAPVASVGSVTALPSPVPRASTSKPAVDVHVGPVCVQAEVAGCWGGSVLSRVCCVCARLLQKHCLWLLWVWLLSRGGAPLEEDSAIQRFLALRSPFIYPGGTWQAAGAQGPAELWLSLVA